MSILSDRTRILREGTTEGKAVLYWMARDKRAADNWALIAAQAHAIKHNLPLIVCFQYTGNYSAKNIRQYGFLFGGLEKTKHILHLRGTGLFERFEGRGTVEYLKCHNSSRITWIRMKLRGCEG